MVTNMIASVGMRVHRGRDWPSEYDDQDRQGRTSSGKIVAGTIQQISNDTCKVQWDNGLLDTYRIGLVGEFHLYVGEVEPESKQEDKVARPIVEFHGTGKNVTWNLIENTSPFQVGDELECIVQTDQVRAGNVVKVIKEKLFWENRDAPMVEIERPDGKIANFYLRRFVPHGATAIRLGYTHSVTSPITLVMSNSYMDWRNFTREASPIIIGDILINLNGAGNKGDLWIVTSLPFFDSFKLCVKVRRPNMSTSPGDTYYLERFARYGELARRMNYTGLQNTLDTLGIKIEVGDRVYCTSDTGKYVKDSGLRIGEICTVRYVNSNTIIIEEPCAFFLEKNCFALYGKKGTFIPPSNYQIINTSTNVTTRSNEAFKVQRKVGTLAGASGYPTSPIQGGRSKAKLGHPDPWY